MRKILGVPVLFLSLGLAVPAMAQQNLNESTIRSGAPAAPKNVYKANPPPDAIPGARPRMQSVAPPEKSTVDMPPTEALFDAINRGDIMTARDAISRGADLDGTNLLGVTPLELSVDLGRNDISFLLLSLRGIGGQRSAGPQSAQADDATPPTPAQRRKAQAQTRAQTVAARREAVGASAPATQNAALFAGNGGTPVPSAGFLGFDPHK